jgi:hypothetical protein
MDFNSSTYAPESGPNKDQTPLLYSSPIKVFSVFPSSNLFKKIFFFFRVSNRRNIENGNRYVRNLE